MSLPDTPNTQRERYYSVIAGQNSTDILPENPVSTENRYLDYIARNGGGGGGGGDTKIFTGTMAEWEALTPDEKAEYTHVFTTDVVNTLAGYGITDAYTKAEVDALIGSETATTLFEGEISDSAGSTAALTDNILNFERICICVWTKRSSDYAHVSEISVKALETAYDLGTSGISQYAGKGAHFFVIDRTTEFPGGVLTIEQTNNGKMSDFSSVYVLQGLKNKYLKIIGIK